MYHLIERMIVYTSLLAMDSKDMNVDQLFQANLIKERVGGNDAILEESPLPVISKKTDKNEDIDTLIRELDGQFEQTNKNK